MNFGYGRVSTTDQDLTIQENALKAAGCGVVRTEKRSGTTTEGRAALKGLLEVMREGDTLVITRIDRLARSIPDLYDIVKELDRKGVALKAIEQPIDTSTAAGKAFFGMLAVFAEFETNLRKERQAEGIAKAKANGVYKGRKATARAKSEKVLELWGQDIGASEIARRLNISRASVYRVVGQTEDAA